MVLNKYNKNFYLETYNEAVKRLKILENEDYAFTENEGQESKAKCIESKYRRNMVTLNEATDKAMKVSRIESDPEDEYLQPSTDGSNSNSSDDASISTSLKNNMFKKPLKAKKKGVTSSFGEKKNSKSNTKSYAVSGNFSFSSSFQI